MKHEETTYHYVVVREDLPLGVIAAQLVHAAGESSPGDLKSGTYAVVLAARSEAHLLELAACLRQAHVPHVLVEEPDPPWNGATMAIGIVPTTDRKRVQQVLGRLPLLRRSSSLKTRSGSSVVSRPSTG